MSDTSRPENPLDAEPKSLRGTGGELHQLPGQDVPVMTSANGTPLSDDENSLRAGTRGPTLIEDQFFREKIFHFDHERIPERVVHARGVGAHGYFEATEDISDITRAAVFRKGERTEVFTRFSTVAGNQGSPDLARDVRGFAVKFYTKEGNWDLVGNNIPVFFIQDAIKFPDLIHAAKQEPDRGFPQAQTAHDNFWDFISLTPESMHMVMWIMSDRTIPRSLRFMEGFGVHTFRLIDDAGKSTYVKFHWKPKQGLQSVVWNEAVKINGADPDFHRRDLWNAIQAGDFPEWELGMQLFDDDFADSFPFDILDATKIIPEEDVPVRIVGRMVLDRVVDNFFAETEQVAFQTGNIVPGIDFTNDPLLQGRNFSYLDTQLKRLGSTNFTHLPVNAPRCPFHHFQQDGHMAFRNPKGRANYQPNSWGGEQGGPRADPKTGYVSYAEKIDGEKRKIRSETFADHYSQARQFYISQTGVEQRHIAMALTFELSKVETPMIRETVVSHLVNIDADLAAKVADGLGIDVPAAAPAAAAVRTDLAKSARLSILLNGPESFKGRKLGILTTDGVDAKLLAGLKAAVEAEGGLVEIVAPKVGGITDSEGTKMPADQKVNGGPSVLYDAVAVLTSKEGGMLLSKEATAKDFVSDAFAHCKFIAYVSEAMPIFTKAGIAEDMDAGCVEVTDGNTDAFVAMLGKLRHWDREPAVHAV